MSEATSDATTDSVPVTIDGTAILARPGELIIDAAERHGVYIPRFCYHPRMEPVGMCRMCLVEVDTGRGPALQPSCMLQVTPDMKVDTQSEVTKKVQDGVLEFLLINHPLDCPVCDKGGECPLQDQTMAYGPGESRYVEEKRHLEKPIPISDLVSLDRERCILCDRCTRFAKDVAGDPLIHFIHRGNRTEVNTFPDEPFASYFSGNTVQICPVGALTASTYRFRARPWDLATDESTCQTCSVGCRIAVESSRDQLLRYQGVDIDPVNWGWLCDKGRFGFQAVVSDERLRQPAVRRGGELVTARWSDAMAVAAGALRDALDHAGPTAIGVLGGAQLTNEGAYAWAKLAKGVLGTDNVDAQLGDGLPADFVAGMPRASIDDVCRPGGTVIVLAPDVKESLPVLFLRLRHAVRTDGVTLIEVAPRRSGLSSLAAASLVYRPGEAAEVMRALVGAAPQGKDAGGIDRDALTAARALLAAADGPVTVILGRPSVAEGAAWIVDAASVLLAARPDTTVLSGLRRANVHGAIDLGLAPGLLPGRVGLDVGRAWYLDAWNRVPEATGLDARGMLEAAAAGRLRVLVLLGADPLQDFPDRALAEAALVGAGTVISLDTTLTASSGRADVVLPTAGFAEVDGTTTNLEGRVSTVRQRVTAPGTARADWMIAAELASALGADLGVRSHETIWEEIERLSPLHAGLTIEVLHSSAASDGVVVPLPSPVNEGPGADEAGDESPATDADAADGGPNDGTDERDRDEVGPEPEGPTRPAMLSFAPVAAEPLVSIDSYGVRLVATRRLYDLGTTVQCSPHLAKLAPGTRLTLNPYDFDRLGVAEGTEVVITAQRPSGGDPVRVRVAAVSDAGVPRGAAAVEVLQPNLDVHALLDASAPLTTVRVDSGSGT